MMSLKAIILCLAVVFDVGSRTASGDAIGADEGDRAVADDKQDGRGHITHEVVHHVADHVGHHVADHVVNHVSEHTYHRRDVSGFGAGVALAGIGAGIGADIGVGIHG